MCTRYGNAPSVSTPGANNFHDRDRSPLRRVEGRAHDVFVSVFDLSAAINVLRAAAPRSTENDGTAIEALSSLLDLTSSVHEVQETVAAVLADHKVAL